MRRLFTILVLIFLTSNTVLSQSQSIKFDTSNLKKQATEMAESFMLSDYKTLVKYTYPKVVQMMGGEQKMLNSINEGLTEMKEQGYIIKSVQVGLTDQSVMAGKEIHTFLTQTLTMSVPRGTVIANSYLLAISLDGGNRWYFLDSTPLSDEEKLKSIFPNFNHSLKIPKKQQPIFVESQ